MLSNFFDDSKISENFEIFKNLLVEKNREFNLTSITEDKEIYIKHFYDSLSGEKFISSGAKVVEIGSGGGFPSVPLKILRQDLDFTLIESIGKKCNFLNLVKNKFNFKNFEVKNARCEDLAKDGLYREKFDYSIARAVANLSTLCEYMLPFVKIGGKMIAYKSVNDEEIENAKNAINILGGKISEIIKYSLPENMGDRYLVIIEKIKNTPPKYPRGKGKERSKPL